MADKIANKAAEGMQGYRNIDTAKVTSDTYNLTKHIVRRISIIENHCWKMYDSKRQAAERPNVNRKNLTPDFTMIMICIGQSQVESGAQSVEALQPAATTSIGKGSNV